MKTADRAKFRTNVIPWKQERSLNGRNGRNRRPKIYEMLVAVAGVMAGFNNLIIRYTGEDEMGGLNQ